MSPSDDELSESDQAIVKIITNAIAKLKGLIAQTKECPFPLGLVILALDRKGFSTQFLCKSTYQETSKGSGFGLEILVRESANAARV